MVALAVRFFGQTPVVCHARPLLNEAYTAVQRGQWIEAGCRLREAVRLYLLAEAEYHEIELSKRKVRQTPRAILDALYRAELCCDYCFERIGEAIEIGNKAAHCQFVTPRDVEAAIASVHWMLDEAPYLQQPIAAGRLA